MNRGNRTKRVSSSSSSSVSRASQKSKTSVFGSSLLALSPTMMPSRSVVSYQTAKTSSDYTRHAKSIQKRGDKPTLEFKAVEHSISKTKTLADGKTVQIFREKVKPVREFIKAHGRRTMPKVRLNPETAEADIHAIVNKSAKTPFSRLKVPEISKPQFKPLNMLFRKADKSNNQRTRRVALTKEARQDIHVSRQATDQYIKALRHNSDSSSLVESTPDAPLAFGDDLALKFKVIDSIIKETKVVIPSSALAGLKDVNDVTKWVIAKQSELATRASTPKEQLPENVTFTNIGHRNRVSEPKWKQYQKAKAQGQIATA